MLYSNLNTIIPSVSNARTMRTFYRNWLIDSLEKVEFHVAMTKFYPCIDVQAQLELPFLIESHPTFLNYSSPPALPYAVPVDEYPYVAYACTQLQPSSSSARQWYSR
jgi:hypothetical protein